jgi:hypothetical protein
MLLNQGCVRFCVAKRPEQASGRALFNNPQKIYQPVKK